MNKRTCKPKVNNKNSRNRSSRRELEQKGTNDPMWYASDPSILRDAASIPYSWSLGTPVSRNNGNPIPFDDANMAALPGICKMDLHPTLGLSVSTDSAVNVAATAMYSFVRHANSGHANYASPDLMLYCAGMAQVYGYINWCQRIYAIATAYTQKNRYIPRHLLASMGINSDDVVNNLANFRYWINVFISKATSLAVPATMSYFSRTAFLYSNIYCESDQIKDQLYYYHPASWLKFEFINETKAGKLKRVTLSPVNAEKGLSISEITNFGDELLQSILLDEDMNIMSGDILKAYGSEGIIKLTSLPESVTLYPVYDPMVLEQIHNATIIACDMGDIEQDPDGGFIMSTPFMHNESLKDISVAMMSKLLSCNKSDPDVTDTIESTRLMAAAEASRSTSTGFYLCCGTEVACQVTYYWLSNSGKMFDVKLTGAADDTNIGPLTVRGYFKYAPTTYMFNATDNKFLLVFESIDNYAVLHPTDVIKMHDAALMNMFAVPSVAKVN